MKEAYSAIGSAYVFCLRALNFISVGLIFFTALWIFGDITGRFLFNHPIPGTMELIKTIIIPIIFLSLPYTLHENRHIQTTILVRRMPPSLLPWLNVMIALVGALIFLAVCRYGWDAAWKSWIIREFEGVQLRVPVYPSRFSIVLGSALMVIEFARILVNDMRNAMGQKREGDR